MATTVLQTYLKVQKYYRKFFESTNITIIFCFLKNFLAPLETKYIRANKAPFLNKELQKGALKYMQKCLIFIVVPLLRLENIKERSKKIDCWFLLMLTKANKSKKNS